MDGRKTLVLATALFSLLSLGGTYIYHSNRMPSAIVIDTKGHPSIGKGKIELVVFEDFLCKNCRMFSERIFPKLTTLYIETGRVRLTVIPLSFIKESKPLANAALAVYRHAPDRFLSFVQELFKTHASNRYEILEAARKVGGIDLSHLADCIDFHLYDDEIDENLNWAKEILGNRFGTPALFVDGVPTSTESFEEIVNRIDQAEKQK